MRLETSLHFNNSFQNLNQREMKLCQQMYEFYFGSTIQLVGALGLFFNLTTALVLLQPSISKKISGHMYQYLMFKSVADSYFGFKNTTATLFRCENTCTLSDYYLTKLLSLIFYFYMGHVCEFLSMFYEVAANFDRYFIISQRFKIHNSQRFYYALMTAATIFTFSIYSYVLLEQDIVVRNRPSALNGTAEQMNRTSSYYVLRYNRMHWSQPVLVLQKVGTVIRDGVFVCLLLIVDTVTILKLRKTMQSKRQLLSRRATNAER